MKKIMSLGLSLLVLVSICVSTSALAIEKPIQSADIRQETILENLRSAVVIRDNSDQSIISLDIDDMLVSVAQLPTPKSGDINTQYYLATIQTGVELVEDKNGETALVAMPRATLTSSETGSDGNKQCKVTVTIGFQTGTSGNNNYMQITSVKAVWSPNSSNISLSGMKARGRCSGFDIFTSTGYFEDNNNIYKSAWSTSSTSTASASISSAPRIQIYAGFGGTLWGDSSATIWAKDGHSWSFDFTASYTQPGG